MHEEARQNFKVTLRSLQTIPTQVIIQMYMSAAGCDTNMYFNVH